MRSFGDFNSHIGISTNILADRLSRLVARGLLRKFTTEQSQRGGAYVLTDAGMDAYPILIALQTWADDWVEDRYRSPVRLIHRACGQTLVQQLRCNLCGVAVDRRNSRLNLVPAER